MMAQHFWCNGVYLQGDTSFQAFLTLEVKRAVHSFGAQTLCWAESGPQCPETQLEVP